MLTDFETFKRHSWILAIKFLEIKHQRIHHIRILFIRILEKLKNGLQINLLCLKDYIKYRFYKRN